MSAPEPIPITVVGSPVAVTISLPVHHVWRRYQQQSKRSTEACGVLLGGYSTDLNNIYVDRCTAPGIRDHRSRCGFVMRSRHHQRVANRLFRETSGEQFYLGTWHTHPCHHPEPSPQDLRDWQECIERNNSFQLFVFTIVGTHSALATVYRNTT
jgi:integrative and conjugative element protein (TIGR02256 family)